MDHLFPIAQAPAPPAHWRVRIERKPRRKRITMTVQPSGAVVVFCQMGTSENFIYKFLHENREWIEKHRGVAEKILSQYPPVYFRQGESIKFCGESYQLDFVYGKRLRFDFEQDQLKVTLPEAILRLPERTQFLYVKKSFQAFYKKQAKRVIGERVKIWSGAMGLQPTKISYRGQKSMWGSCNSEGRISLNWKLMVFPLHLIDCVVIHELAHLRHRDHSKAFWQLVGQFDSRAKEHRHQLNKNQYAADFLSTRCELYPELSLV